MTGIRTGRGIKAGGLAVAFVIGLILLFQIAAADESLPALTSRVVDNTATLSDEQRQTLDRSLEAFEKKKGSQIVVVVVPSTAPEAIEQYSIRLAERWRIGRKGVDDGAILLIAKNDHKLRIEVGYGLEGALNDAVSKRIIEDIILPYFKSGDFYSGIQAGVQAIMKVVEGEPLPAPKTTSSNNSNSGFFGAVVGFIIVTLVLRSILGKGLGATAGSVIGLIGGAVLLGLLAGLGIGVLCLIFGLASQTKGGLGGFGGIGGGGWNSSSSGGGFSGGGGSFGGGGASGSW